jgi:peroxiredoxin
MRHDKEAKRMRQRARDHTRGRRRLLRNAVIATIVTVGVGAVILLGLIAGSGTSGTSVPGTGYSVGDQAADFRIRTTSWSGGNEFILAQHQGKPVAIYAVAGWCGTCIPETQAWANIYRDLGDKLTVLIFSGDPSETEQSLLHFKEAAGGGNHPWAVDDQGVLVGALNIRSLDTTVLIDAQGKIAYREGVTGEGKLREQLSTLIGAGTSGNAPATAASP